MKRDHASPKKGSRPVEADLSQSLYSLQKTIEALPRTYSHIVNPGKNLFFTYVKGIVYGLGALTAVAIVVPIIVAMLQRVPWSPIVSNFVEDVVERMEKN